MRFWVFVATWDPVANVYGPLVRRVVPPFVCLSAQQAALVDPRVAVLAAVREQWRSFGLPAAVVRTLPAGVTLAGAVTRVSSPTPAVAVLPARLVLGVPVTLTVSAVSYRWDFGDGALSVLPATSAGVPVEHVYRVAGGLQVSVATVYSATFSLAGDPTVYPLDGVAVVPGTPTVLTVGQARTQLEAGPGR